MELLDTIDQGFIKAKWRTKKQMFDLEMRSIIKKIPISEKDGIECVRDASEKDDIGVPYATAKDINYIFLLQLDGLRLVSHRLCTEAVSDVQSNGQALPTSPYSRWQQTPFQRVLVGFQRIERMRIRPSFRSTPYAFSVRFSPRSQPESEI